MARHNMTSNLGEILSLVTGALGIWIGLQSFRSFLATVVWIIGEDRSTNFMGAVAFGIFALGLIAYIPARLFGGDRPEIRFGVMLAAIFLAHQGLANPVIAHPAIVATLAGAGMVAWLWWVPAFVDSLSGNGASIRLSAFIIVGLSADAVMRTFLSGVDLSWVHGILPFGGALLLAGAFVALLLANQSDRSGTLARPGWGLIAVGPYLFLQLTLLTNLGSVQTMSGSTSLLVISVVTISLVTAGIALTLPLPPLAHVIGGLVAVGMLWQYSLLEGSGIWLMPVIQAGLAMALVAALTPSERNSAGRLYLSLAIGGLLLFVLTFLYYSEYGWPLLWTIASGLIMLISLFVARPLRPALKESAVALLIGLAVIGPLGAYALERPVPMTLPGPAPQALKVITYNIHMGLDDRSLPAPEAIAREIEASGAHIVGLQEVGRGWNVNGGVDLALWFTRRLPNYHVVYHPMNGPLWGNLILSQYPIKEDGYAIFDEQPRDNGKGFGRGFQWATIETEVGDLLVMNTHFTAYEGSLNDQDRAFQATELLKFWAGRPRAIALGDFNAEPGDLAIEVMLAGGMSDLAAQMGLGQTFTFNASNPHVRLDYVFGSQDVQVRAAKVRQTSASDHLPVEVEIELQR